MKNYIVIDQVENGYTVRFGVTGPSYIEKTVKSVQARVGKLLAPPKPASKKKSTWRKISGKKHQGS